MKANSDKCHLLITNVVDKPSIKIGNDLIVNSDSEKLLGITFDNKLLFDKHVSLLCKKASQKLHALSRIAHFMDVNKRTMIMKAFISSQFGYSPLIWMFHSRKSNNRINSLHERTLRIVYNDTKSTFSQLLEKDNAVTIHQKNLQILVTKIKW